MCADYHQLRENAKRRIKEWEDELERRKQEDERLPIEFAKIGPYVPSEETKAQLRRLAEIQRQANEYVDRCNWVIG